MIDYVYEFVELYKPTYTLEFIDNHKIRLNIVAGQAHISACQDLIKVI